MRRDNGSIMKRIYRVRWLLLVLMVVWWPKVSAILDAREIEALIELGAAVPQLSPKPASRPTFYSDPFNAPDDPTWDWPTTETGWLKICADGDGPNVYGLTCNNGHIVGINWYVRKFALRAHTECTEGHQARVFARLRSARSSSLFCPSYALKLCSTLFIEPLTVVANHFHVKIPIVDRHNAKKQRTHVDLGRPLQPSRNSPQPTLGTYIPQTIVRLFT